MEMEMTEWTEFAADWHNGMKRSTFWSEGQRSRSLDAEVKFVDLAETNFLYRDRSLLPWALGRFVHLVLPRGTLFQLGYGTHHWHSNNSSVCSRRHCLRDCHRTPLSDSSLLFVRFEVSVYCYYYYYPWSHRVRWCLAGLACGDQCRHMGTGSALEVLCDYVLYKYIFTLLYFN